MLARCLPSKPGSRPRLSPSSARGWLELERERELLNAIANWAPSLLCLVGADGRVRPYASNKAFERTMGYQSEESGGELFWERYVPPEDAPDVRAAIEEVIAGGPVEERDGRWLTRSGKIIHVLWSCTPLPMEMQRICRTPHTRRDPPAQSGGSRLARPLSRRPRTRCRRGPRRPCSAR